MLIKVDVICGDILTLFNESQGPLCVRDIEEHLYEPQDVILMTLGWLMREGFIDSEYLNGDLLFRLQKKGKFQY